MWGEDSRLRGRSRGLHLAEVQPSGRGLQSPAAWLGPASSWSGMMVTEAQEGGPVSSTAVSPHTLGWIFSSPRSPAWPSAAPDRPELSKLLQKQWQAASGHYLTTPLPPPPHSRLSWNQPVTLPLCQTVQLRCLASLGSAAHPCVLPGRGVEGHSSPLSRWENNVCGDCGAGG